MNKDIAGLEQIIGYAFRNKELLREALTHSSYLNESKQKNIRHNERLEFFGDAIIEFHVSEFLFGKYKDFPEGTLTKTRAAMVCESGLAECARAIKLGDFIMMGRGEELSGGRTRESITSDAFEALTAAIHIDSEGSYTKEFIRRHLIDTLEDKSLFFDAKTRLQEIVQKNPENTLTYELIAEEGPVHERNFIYGVFLNGKKIGQGQGHSKKAAQQQAALEAIKITG